MADSLALLDRLDGVKQTGPDTWRAFSPVGSGRSRSLSIKYVNSQLIIHDFAGATVQEIVESVGLRVSDLFDKATPYSPAIARKHRINTNAREILYAVIIPIRVVTIAVAIQKDRPLTLDEYQSFERASATINKALDTAVNQGVINVS